MKVILLLFVLAICSCGPSEKAWFHGNWMTGGSDSEMRKVRLSGDEVSIEHNEEVVAVWPSKFIEEGDDFVVLELTDVKRVTKIEDPFTSSEGGIERLRIEKLSKNRCLMLIGSEKDDGILRSAKVQWKWELTRIAD
jgi:hypothetical protein